MPSQFLKNLKEQFELKPADCREIISAFSREMANGLAGRKSSLKMIPAYVDVPKGDERGRFIAVDLGGTNLRVLEIELSGRGRIKKLKEKKFVIDKKYTRVSADELFGFIAKKIKDLLRWQPIEAGFTFSFPVRQTAIASGVLAHWTKDFCAKGVVGKDVVKLLERALYRQGIYNLKITALVNDTVGTLVCRGYSDVHSDVGIILGTGTNACYREALAKIIKWRGTKPSGAKMIVNIEWGNFNKLTVSCYDRQLDRASENSGEQILEKMVGGMYLGEIVRLILVDLCKKDLIFDQRDTALFGRSKSFKSEYMSEIEADCTADLSRTKKILKYFGIKKCSFSQAALVKKVCELVAARAANISGSCLAAVIKRIDPALKKKHTVAIDGSVYEKHPVFSRQMRKALKTIFGQKAKKVQMVLTKDGSGVGAAIIAAVAAKAKKK